MMSLKVLKRICTEQDLDPIALRESAELEAQPQDDKFWGLTDAQCDVIALMHNRGNLQAAVTLAVLHYRSINSNSTSRS